MSEKCSIFHPETKSLKISSWRYGITFPPNHSKPSQIWASVSSCIWKKANSTVLWVCYAALWNSMNSSLTRCTWLVSHVLEEAGVSFHPSLLVVVIKKKMTCEIWLVGENWPRPRFVWKWGTMQKEQKRTMKINICWTADTMPRIFIPCMRCNHQIYLK